MEAEDIIQVLDLRGLNCPLPVLKAQKAMRSMQAKQAIWLETTDPLAAIDIPAFCENDGHELKATEQADGFSAIFSGQGFGLKPAIASGFELNASPSAVSICGMSINPKKDAPQN